mmetsp:Transcript_32224/g.69645  ORF Transcript_32224/g.69645 Transcript_32224/m.69645 type:complete len:242 (+) Transcript_32224:15-740(+)
MAPKRRKSGPVLPADVSFVRDKKKSGGDSDSGQKSQGLSGGDSCVIQSMKPGPILGAYTISDIKHKFMMLDTNGDGILSRDEMSVLLRKGREDLSDAELEVLWDDMNHDGDEGIDFDEFVDYLFGVYSKDGAKIDWEGTSNVFHTIADAAGRPHITYHEFLALCRQLDILDDTGFGITEAAALFKECRSKRGLCFDRFKLLLKKVAKTKNVPLRTVVNWIASFTPGRANEDVQDTWAACHQ